MSVPQTVKHPGQHLLGLMETYNLSETAVAERAQLSEAHLHKIIAGESFINVIVALKLGKFFGNDAEFWLGLQSKFDLAQASKAVNLDGIIPLRGGE